MRPVEDIAQDFIAEIGRAAWFAACGEPLGDSERAEAAALASFFGFGEAPVTPVADWRAAGAVLQRPDWSRDWWDRQSAAEAALKAKAAALYGADRLLAALSGIAGAASTLDGAAARSLAHGGVADEALVRVAAGAAAQACHQAALALAADEGAGHGFALCFALYAAGRWPLGVVGGRMFVF